MLKEALTNDPLHRLERQAKVDAERCILMAAKLISPVIDNNFSIGYQWSVRLTYLNFYCKNRCYLIS